jgi:hypothetical protein
MEMMLMNKPEVKVTTEYEKAAIIGYWRSGASWMEIAAILGYPVWMVEKIVNDYLKSIA